MKIAILGFTENGSRTGACLLEQFLEEGEDAFAVFPERFLSSFSEKRADRLYSLGEKSFTEWSRICFLEDRAMLFIGAAGIAVRAIAPWVKDKFKDPPVISMDETGHFVIPLLSGHAGGANALALRISKKTGAVPVITTATDCNGLFAVDVFAKENGLALTDRKRAKEVSAALLQGKPVGFFSDFPLKELPGGCVPFVCCQNVWITVKDETMEKTEYFPQNGTKTTQKEETAQTKSLSVLRLVPKVLVLGIGCRKGVPFDILKRQVQRFFAENHLDIRAVKEMASIDLKKEEPALLKLAEEYGWPLRFYCSEELAQIPGEFNESDFVKKTTGVGNVCERSACAGGGKLIAKKQAAEGVTVAAALELPKEFKMQA